MGITAALFGPPHSEPSLGGTENSMFHKCNKIFLECVNKS
jgi:hypothetical protein